MALHHPHKSLYPDWTIYLGNQQFHLCVTIVQRLRPTAENLAIIRGLIDSLEYEYLRKRRYLDIAYRCEEDH